MKKSVIRLTQGQLEQLEKDGLRDEIQNSTSGLLIGQIFLLPTSRKGSGHSDGTMRVAWVRPPHSTKIVDIFKEIVVQERTTETVINIAGFNGPTIKTIID